MMFHFKNTSRSWIDTLVLIGGSLSSILALIAYNTINMVKEKYFKRNTLELIKQFLIISSQRAYETFKSLFTWLKLYAYVAIVQQQFKLETSFNSWVAEEGLLNNLGASCTTFIVHLSFIPIILWYLVAKYASGQVILYIIIHLSTVAAISSS